MMVKIMVGNERLVYKDNRVVYNDLLFDKYIKADNEDTEYIYNSLIGDIKHNLILNSIPKKRTGWIKFTKAQRSYYKLGRKVFKRAFVRRISNVFKVAKVFVNITTNNTHITVTTLDKDSIKRSIICSAGFLLGIKGTKRSSPLATEMVVKRALYRLNKRNKQARILHLYISGVGRGRSVVRKALIRSRFKIKRMREITAIPHNGTRKPSRRRV